MMLQAWPFPQEELQPGSWATEVAVLPHTLDDTSLLPALCLHSNHALVPVI